MDDLVAFVRRCFDEDEELARVAAALTRSPWVNEGSTVMCGDGFAVAGVEDGETATAQHIARWDPARVLAEVDAQRTLLDDLVRELDDDDTNETARWYVQLLAQPYAGREGWRKEWTA